MTTQTYSLYGLCVASAVPLPGIMATNGAPDAAIITAKLDPPPMEELQSGLHVHGTDKEVYVRYDGTATFRIRGGTEIACEPEDGHESERLSLFALAAPFGVLLRQRGFLVLHAGAIEIDGVAVAFMGPSGAGKSSMAAALEHRGHPFVADDHTVLDLDARPPMLHPGPARTNLSPEMAALFNREVVVEAADDYRIGKQGCLAQNVYSGPPLPLVCVYALDYDQECAIETLSQQEAMRELLGNSFGVRALRHVGGRKQFLQCAALANTIPVKRLKRPRDLSKLPFLAELIERDAAKAGALQAPDATGEC